MGSSNSVAEIGFFVWEKFAKTRLIDDLAIHPLVLGVLDRVLGEHYLLGGPTAIRIEPGEVAQMLHRDEDQYPIPNPPRDLGFNVLWALDDFTEANGATRMVPGSQRDALVLEVGTRDPVGDKVIYPDIDMIFERAGSERRYNRKSGEPYSK